MQKFAVGQARAWAVPPAWAAPSGIQPWAKLSAELALGAGVGLFWGTAVPQHHCPEPGLAVLFDPAYEAAGAGSSSISTAHTSQRSGGSSRAVNGGAKRGPGLGAN